MAFEFNVLDVEINIPSEDIRNYTMFVSGHPGCGKTTLIKQIPGSFTIDADRGAKSHAMMAQQVTNWDEVTEVVKQLVQMRKMNEKAKKAKEKGEKEVEIKIGKKKVTLPVDVAIEQTDKIKFVSLDTINQLKQYAKDHLIELRNQQYLEEGKDKVATTFNELGWGNNDELEKLLMGIINDLRDNDYGVAQISHIKDKKYNKDTEDEYIKVVPDLQDNERNYLVGASDIEIQIVVEDVVLEKAEKKDNRIVKNAKTEQKTWMYLRANNERAAKSRFVYLPERIEYGYQNLVGAVKEAVKKEVEYGKSIYNIDDNKVEDLKNKQEEIKKQKIEEMLEETEKQEIQETLEEILEQIKELANVTVEKYKCKKSDVAAVFVRPLKNIDNLTDAKQTLENIKNFTIKTE